MLFSNGDMFVGHWHSDLKHGYGQMTGKQGEFKGEYEHDMKQGNGRERVKVKAQWVTYEGEFQTDMKQGVGKIDYQGQGCYQGSFERGAKHGEGVWSDFGKKGIYQVKFDRDRLVRMMSDRSNQETQQFRSFTLV